MAYRMTGILNFSILLLLLQWPHIQIESNHRYCLKHLYIMSIYSIFRVCVAMYRQKYVSFKIVRSNKLEMGLRWI